MPRRRGSALQNCIDSEHRTRDQLDKNWSSFPASSRTFCLSSIAHFAPTYTELATCLEMRRDLANPKPPKPAPPTGWRRRASARRSRQPRFNSLKKSLPLSSTTMKAGKSTTSIRQIASMPSSGYSTVSTFLMQCSARFAATPPIEPR